MSKTTKLLLGLFMDAVGMLSYVIPGIGETIDIVWAPISAFILTKIYPGKVGKVGAIVNFVEELSPGLDIIPTYTLTWIYVYYLERKEKL